MKPGASPSPNGGAEPCEVGRLILLPVSLADTPWQSFLPAEAHARAVSLRHFVVETAKTARAQLKRLEHPLPLSELNIRELPAKATTAELDALLAPLHAGDDLGLLSDAGCPAVADPGSRLVARAHAQGLTVQPLVGPSSLLLALMGSGLNGQSFAFSGYLPVAEHERDQAIRALEAESARLARTQIFIETPYRNTRLFDALLRQCRPDSLLCVARDLTGVDEYISTRRITDWRRSAAPDLQRRPALFLLLAGSNL